MKQNVGRVVLAQRDRQKQREYKMKEMFLYLLKSKLAVFLFGFLLLTPSVAGDRALLDVIGYSTDKRYFAFEEFGIQDGSGFAYSSIYIIDLKDDAWVIGTPIRVISDDLDEPIDFAKSLNDVRLLVRQKAQQRLDGLSIIWPAHLLAQIGDGAIDEDGLVKDGLALKFGVLGYGFDSIIAEYEMSLEIYETHSATSCMEYFDKEPMGFLIDIKEMDEITRVYEDGALARSRACPITYKINSVYMPFEASDISSAVAIISVYSYGYEGPDRRFVAVPIGNKN